MFTYVWALEDERHRRRLVQEYVEIVESRAVQCTSWSSSRRRRSGSNLLELDANCVMSTGSTPTLAEELFEGRGYLRLDNTELPAAEVAARVVNAFELPRVG